ncbi:MAG TPA: hypothetical protein VMY42_01670 [Thermoguttaceae bacterium]|nr:hypothetical protein [Thermoguttaceae bacterium]
MIYRGHVKNGLVVLDDAVVLPEGARVKVDVVTPSVSDEANKATDEENGPADLPPLMKYAGIAKDLPPDAARNLDHYLYGHPKS